MAWSIINKPTVDNKTKLDIEEHKEELEEQEQQEQEQKTYNGVF
jgi:hypothetical protein